MAPIPLAPAGGNAQELLRLLQQDSFNTVFQPVLDLHGCEVFGFEAAVRGPADSALHSPLVLFDTAAQENKLVELDLAACRAACRRFVALNLPASLFLNVTSPSLVNQEFQSALTDLVIHELGLNAGRVILEITEQHPLDDFDGIRQAAAAMQSFGFRIAMDDLGAGYAGLRLWSELKPHFVKVDRHFIQNIQDDPVKRDFVRSIYSMGQDLACSVIAEGIETPEELKVIQQIGIGLGQGFLLGMPRPVPVTTVPVIVSKPQRVAARLRSRMLAGELARPCQTVSPDLHAETVLDLFLADRSLNVIPVVHQGQPLGLVLRHELSEMFSVRFQRELHGRKPVRQFMRTRPVCVEDTQSIEEISRLITDSPEEELAQNYLVTHQGQFVGVGATRSLLRRITEMQINSARHCNPLTQLPGNVPIYEYVEFLLANDEDFHVAYCDLNHFKPYNDMYGYARGDAVLQMTADILRRHSGPGDFIGHIGGDDFVVIMQSQDWQLRCEAILIDFDLEIRSHYPTQALEQGGVYCEDRRGHTAFLPLTGLAIGVVHPDPVQCIGHNDVAALATAAKHQAKKMPGSALFVSRRRASLVLAPERSASVA